MRALFLVAALLVAAARASDPGGDGAAVFETSQVLSGIETEDNIAEAQTESEQQASAAADQLQVSMTAQTEEALGSNLDGNREDSKANFQATVAETDAHELAAKVTAKKKKAQLQCEIAKEELIG